MKSSLERVCISSSIWVSLSFPMHGWSQSHLKGVPQPHQVSCGAICEESPSHLWLFLSTWILQTQCCACVFHVSSIPGPPQPKEFLVFFSLVLSVQALYCAESPGSVALSLHPGPELMVVVEGRASSPCLVSARLQHWAGGRCSMEGAPPLEVFAS